ncbi:Nectin-1 [Holothuria leucospilota]|uniref:Nectin-1 n=1 Tax=Holothuria leucospilota TaxID=206669 RepID=A0A9Q1BXQ3_HOLLE|nr:Nectin-1 [Holothuria leucospilota]
MEGRILAFILIVCNLCMRCCEGDTARNETIAENSLAQFSCNVEDISTTIWLFTGRKEVANSESISQGDIVYPKFEDKFEIEMSSYNSSSELNLKFNVTEEDEGLYLCQEGGTNKAQFRLTVEIPPVLQLKRENLTVSTDMDVVFNEQVTITCIAEGGKPPVRLSWKVNGQEKTGPFIDNSPPSPDRRITSVIHYQPTLDDNRLACVASGQQVISEQEVSVGINVQYLLNCLIVVTNDTNAFIITCSCEANPDVEKYMIYVNKTLFSENQEAKLPSEKGATVFCIATNKVANYTTKEVELKPFHEEVPAHVTRVALIIWLSVAGIIVVIVVIVAVVCICRKMKDVDEAEAHAKEAREEATRIQMNQTAAVMSMVPVPDWDSKKDDNTPLKDSDKEETPDKGEGSTKTLEQKDGNQNAADMAVKPLPDDYDLEQEKENLMSNAE